MTPLPRKNAAQAQARSKSVWEGFGEAQRTLKTYPEVESTFRHFSNCPKNVAECADCVVLDLPVHRWSRGARTRRTCAASITPSASSTLAEGLGRACLPVLQHPACPLDAYARRNRQVRTSTRTLRPATHFARSNVEPWGSWNPCTRPTARLSDGPRTRPAALRRCRACPPGQTPVTPPGIATYPHHSTEAGRQATPARPRAPKPSQWNDQLPRSWSQRLGL
jgi:hypothetical protein